MSAISLKPCPFCGATEEDISIKTKKYKGNIDSLQGEIYSYIECNDCDVRTRNWLDSDAIYEGFKTGKEAAAAIWNTRK